MENITLAIPSIRVADVAHNTDEMLRILKSAIENEDDILVFPALCVTGATCGDLFRYSVLTAAAEEATRRILTATEGCPLLVVFGVPRWIDTMLYSCAIAVQNGHELACVRNAARTRHFAAGEGDTQFTLEDGTSIWLGFAQPGNTDADVAICLDASPTIVGARDIRRKAVIEVSAESNCIAVYINAGFGESSTDYVFGGEGFVARNGALLAETEGFSIPGEVLSTTVNADFEPAPRECYVLDDFLPAAGVWRDKALRELLQIQTAGLAKRILHTGAKRLVLGISGGLDSTLALIVSLLAARLLGREPSSVLTVTMPGYGTSGRTYANAKKLMDLLGTEQQEISIKPACEQHFDDIEHNRELDLTFENAQARERTQILMDIAGMCNGLMVGSGDMTELALGFATYNGDHMSAYGVNAGVPKTVVREAVQYAAQNGMFTEAAGAVLMDIVETPISPELLPPLETGDIAQKTEEIVGPYALNDFFLYHTMQHKAAPETILSHACKRFPDYEEAFIRENLNAFHRRFFAQQFKRTCLPDGPQVFSLSLSPRGGLDMPSDAVGTLWQL